MNISETEKELLEREYYNTLKDWAVTIEIPAFKKIKFNKSNKAYKNYDFTTQKNILLCYYKKMFDELQINMDYVFEQHKDKRWHMHATVYQITEKVINTVNEWFCKDIVGLPYPKQYNQICYYKPVFKHSGWCDYCVKDMLLNIQEKEAKQNTVKIIESVQDEDNQCIVKFDRYNQYLFI